MTVGRCASIRLLGAVVATILFADRTVPASAQTTANTDKQATSAKSNKTAANPTTAKPTPVKPKSAKTAEQGTDYWAINTDVGKYSNAARGDNTSASPKDPGRVPLQNAPGTVGFASQPVRSGQFSDGRTVPGLDRFTQDPQSYVGLSLSVPSSNNSFPIPGPLFPRNDW